MIEQLPCKQLPCMLLGTLPKNPPGLYCPLPGSGVKSAPQEDKQSCEAVCHIGGLSNWKNANADFEAEADWRILSGEASRNWIDDQKKSEEVMVQSLIKKAILKS